MWGLWGLFWGCIGILSGLTTSTEHPSERAPTLSNPQPDGIWGRQPHGLSAVPALELLTGSRLPRVLEVDWNLAYLQLESSSH